MGGHIVNYDSMIVLTHFKGHAMGGFGGSMKNIAIGCADGKIGKAMVHGVYGKPLPEDWNAWPAKEELMERMAESAKATVDYFGKHIVFLNVMRRMSVDCDCAGVSAAEPTIPDIGILASTDILAIRPIFWRLTRRALTLFTRSRKNTATIWWNALKAATGCTS